MTLTAFSLLLTGVLLNAVAQLCLKAGTTRVGEFAFSADNIIPIPNEVMSNTPINQGNNTISQDGTN